ncbi:hypothetical protein [Qipengyuania mesophila]
MIPKALTYGAEKRLPFAQAGRDIAPIKRWDSWYDQRIVTQAGETILEAYDDWAIRELRSHHLVWSGWGQNKTVPAKVMEIPNSGGWGVRKVTGIDGGRLRLFFLSLLWRAAVSEMPEFEEVRLHASDVRRLRNMVRDGDPNPSKRFPIALVQLSTIGAIHNLCPLQQRKPKQPWLKNGPSYPIFRFYFDGLIAHIHTEISEGEVEELGPMFVGNQEELAVSTIPFETSWQRGNLSELIREAETRWPERLAKIPGFGPN